MKLNYTYKIQGLSPAGMATVEYRHEELGSITRVFVVPWDRGEEEVRRRIVERFPIDLFYSRHLSTIKTGPPLIMGLLNGKMSVDFSDHFYDVQEMSTHEAKSS